MSTKDKQVILDFQEQTLVEAKEPEFKFIDLFAGIGGFHIAMHRAGGDCVFAAEWDKFARVTYETNYKHISPDLFSSGRFIGDVTQVSENLEMVPDFDVLCAGFPCQPFSNAGHKKGFEDTRGTLFFNIAEIVDHKVQLSKQDPSRRAPKVLLLENVKGLKGHDKGRTLKTILETLENIGYKYSYEVLNSKNFGVPQNRERLFIIAWLDTPDAPAKFSFPYGLDENDQVIYDASKISELAKRTYLGQILEEEVDPKYTISQKLHEGHLRRREMHKQKGNGFGFSLFKYDSPYTSTISARYYKDGSEIMIHQDDNRPRKLTPSEAARLQGYPAYDHLPEEERFKIPVSDGQAYKQFGNSVSVPVVSTLAKEIKKQLL
ncbi:DNA (cytosine-5-)-methyltransferase [Pontibacter populi]|uniref:Cytosine-specific methyltransferase n=1 Tax=Pontibacter populi TaxID=890055 RepID=A0ABV1RSM9_9BACT